jgi:hypothetical protein
MRAIVVLLLLASPAWATTPNDAVGWAIAHQLITPPESRPYYRYVWIADYMLPPDSEWAERHIAAAMSYAINEAASQTGLVIIPRSIANGWMLAVYLPNYASATKLSVVDEKRTELQVLVDTWDGLAVNEPYFHTLSEQSGIAVPTIAGHIDADRIQALAELNASPSLVYRADWLLVRLLDTHYYEFAQLPSTQEAVYAKFGANEEASQALDGDQRIAMFDSGVTGKPRRIDRFQGLGGRWNTGQIYQTWDLLDESASPLKHPLYNLLAFKPDGGEAIIEKPNGMHAYILFDEQRNILREAPPELASDHTIPGPPEGPGSARLVAGISCIRCHNPSEGYHGAENDVQKLLAAGVDITDDLLDPSQREAVHRIAGLYAGDFTRRLRLARDDYTEAVRRATIQPGMPAGLSVPEAGKVVSELYASYTWRRVTPVQAERELGRTIRETWTVAPGNPVMGALLAGIPVRRQDWEQVFAAAMVAARQVEGE